jgi:hypothetical protein
MRAWFMAVSRGRRSDLCLGDNTGRAHSTGAGSQRRGRDAKVAWVATEKTSVGACRR